MLMQSAGAEVTCAQSLCVNGAQYQSDISLSASSEWRIGTVQLFSWGKAEHMLEAA